MADQYEFDIGLFAGGDEGGYHIQDLPDQKQREYLIQRTYGSDRMVKARLVDVIHGRLSSDGAPASLIVSTFKFLGSTPSKRFRYASITWDFAYSDAEEIDWPEVKKISLDDQFVMKMTTFDKSAEVKAEAALQGGAGPAVGLNLSTGWTRAQSAKIDDHVSLYGSSTFTHKNAGEPNGAKWVLEENKSQNSGIPGSLTTAILLKRKPGKPFVGTIQIKAKVDVGSAIEDLFGRKPKVDPVLFDLERPPTSAKYDPQNLDAIVLDDIGIAKLYDSL